MIATDNSTGHLRIGSSHYIEFALWILVQDGLQVSPFDKHTGGHKVLQSLGMTPIHWNDWLRRLVIKHDNRLGWHVPDINAQVEKNVESFKKMIGMVSQAHGIDYNAIYGQHLYESQSEDDLTSLIEQEQGYQQALIDYEGLDINWIKDSEPPHLYLGNQQVKERLIELWDEYNSSSHLNEFINSTLLIPKIWDVQANPPTDKYREMFLVDYPFEVEVFIPPIFAIVTVPNRPLDQAHLEQRMFSILQNS